LPDDATGVGLQGLHSREVVESNAGAAVGLRQAGEVPKEGGGSGVIERAAQNSVWEAGSKEKYEAVTADGTGLRDSGRGAGKGARRVRDGKVRRQRDWVGACGASRHERGRALRDLYGDDRTGAEGFLKRTGVHRYADVGSGDRRYGCRCKARGLRGIAGGSGGAGCKDKRVGAGPHRRCGGERRVAGERNGNRGLRAASDGSGAGLEGSVIGDRAVDRERRTADATGNASACALDQKGHFAGDYIALNMECGRQGRVGSRDTGARKEPVAGKSGRRGLRGRAWVRRTRPAPTPGQQKKTTRYNHSP
jgi:hypothetical protein